jgi:hypothetical protein
MLAYMAADCSSTGALGEDNAFALGKRLRWKEDIYCI